MARRSIFLVFFCALAACGGGGGGGDADCPAGGPGTASLAWTASASPEVTGYRVYHGLAPGSYGAGRPIGRVQCHVVGGLDSGTTYYFAVTAIDGAGNESDYSNEASKRID